jgi:hypothetical protein
VTPKESTVVDVLLLATGSSVACRRFKTFYGRNFRMSQTVCPWQAFPAKSDVCG